MRAGDEAFEALREAIDALADAEVTELVAEARTEARAKVRSILAEAMAQALLERSQAELCKPLGATRARTGSIRPAPGPEEAMPAQAAAGESEIGDAQAPDSAGELGWYVYCVVGDTGLGLPASLTGVDARHRVCLLVEGDLAAVASQVPLSEFGEQRLRESLNDLDWLEATARAHEHVLDEARALTTVIPMRLCTIYHSESSVRQMLAREREALSEALVRLAGKTEWGLKMFADSVAVERAAKEASDELAGLYAELEGASAGNAYMQRKQLEGLLRDETERLIDACAEDVHSRLSALAVEALSNPLQRQEASGHSGQMVLNGVYLLDDACTDEFHACAARLIAEHAPRGFDLKVTGPWPPYNFVKSSIEAAW